MNCKKEFIELVVSAECKVKCVKIHTENWSYDPEDVFKLKVGHTEDELNTFLAVIDFDYNSGYGSQRLYGNVWFTDGRWACRQEYDGSEWWEIMECPTIPGDLK